MEDKTNFAPGWPGIPPRWTSSAKDGIGTALNSKSHVWFTHSHGILNEIYYPDVDKACTRDLGLLVTDGKNFFSEEKRHTQTIIEHHAPGIPAFRIFNTCNEGRYRIEKDIIADPGCDVVLQRTRFIPLKGSISDYHLFVLLAPHLGNQGNGNTAWIDDQQNLSMMFAVRNGNALALACSTPWLKMSVGFAGLSDGWKDVQQHKMMKWNYTRAENGNVAIIGEIDLQKCNGEFVIAIGFGNNPSEAAKQVSESLKEDFKTLLHTYVAEWNKWQNDLLPQPKNLEDKLNIYKQSVAVLRTCESKLHPGGIIASLSIPWGFSKGDNDLGGYHLVWARDLVETASALLAAGANAEVLRIIRYLNSTQRPDGHWPQNMWINGSPYWPGIQMDETAFPILLIDMAYRNGLLKNNDLKDLWKLVRKAAEYLTKNGPVTQEDRWEEDPGYSPFTLAVQIAGLLAAGDIAEISNEKNFAQYLRETADYWNSNIEQWTYVTNTEISRRIGVEGYYVRIAPPDIGEAASPLQGFVPIKNRPVGESDKPAVQIISPDMLALVRFGLRSPDDSRIVNTIKVIDSLLKVETTFGQIWHRYSFDGYGEHEDGSPFDGTGIGRGWPLLVGERAHYELAAGHRAEAIKLLKTMQSFANEGGMIPEQIWDSPDIPERELFFGRPSGSAMPLAWAHGEYIKLARSIQDGRVFDTPPQTVNRYINKKNESPFAVWRFNHKCSGILVNKILRIETLSPAIVHWSNDNWQTIQDVSTKDTGFGIHIVELPTQTLSVGEKIDFTFFWIETTEWEGSDFTVQIRK